MAMHPDKQEKAQKVADGILKNKDFITYEDYQSDQLNYIKFVVKETLRLRSPGFMIGRKVIKEVRLGNYVFPKNVNLFQKN
jgi:cytochrome P450